jgi:hypothetical protein
VKTQSGGLPMKISAGIDAIAWNGSSAAPTWNHCGNRRSGARPPESRFTIAWRAIDTPK